MFIDRIEKKDAKKQLVYFENGTFCPLYNTEIRKYELSSETNIDDNTYDEIYLSVVLKRAKLRSMNLLKSYDKTEAQLRIKLMDDGYDENTIDETIDYMKSFKYIDDYRIAKNYYDYHCDNDSHNNIKIKLLGKGISKDIIEKVLSESDGSGDERSLEALIIKRKVLEKCTDAKNTSKQIAFLIRKGYSYELVRNKLQELLKKMD